MNTKHGLAMAVLAGVGLAVAGMASAAPVTMTFDELQLDSIAGGQYVSNYYDGGCGTSFNGGSVTCGGPDWGVVWSGAAVTKGGPTLTNMPSSPNAIIPSVPPGPVGQNPAMIMNVANGFDSGFSFYYSARNSLSTVTLYGSGGIDDVLATITLASTPTVCDGGAGLFHCWNFVDDLAFSGTVYSVAFSGSFNNVAFDNISFDMSDGASADVPEPGVMGIFGFGGLVTGGLLLLRRRRELAAA